MNISEFMNSDNKDKYIVVGRNKFADKILDNFLGNFRVMSNLPKGNLLANSVVVRDNEDILSEDFSELNRNYRFAIQVDKKDGRRKLFKSASNKDIIFVDYENNEKFIINKVIDILGINKKKASKLVKYCEQDMNMIYNEVNKLKYLTKEQLNKLISSLIVKDDKDIFKFLNNLFSGKGYLSELYRLNDHSMKLLYMITKMARDLIICRDCINKSNKSISNEFGMHNYQVKIYKGIAKNYSIDELKDIFYECNKIEGRIKTGQIDSDVALDYICNYIGGG